MIERWVIGLMNVLWRGFRLRRLCLQVGSESAIRLWKVRAAPRGELLIGSQSQIETRIIQEREGARLQIGSRSFLGGGWISCASEVTIGDDVLISWGVAIFDHGSHALAFSGRSRDVMDWREGQKDWSGVEISPVRIENKAWIGFRSIILPGITIGEGSIVGAGSVVTRDVAPWTIVAGNPARFIREIPEDER